MSVTNTAAEPRESIHQLAVHALAAWDLEAIAVEPLKFRENALFRVEAADGSRLALRVHRAGYHSDLALLSEFAWLQALARDGLEVPRVVRSKRGRCFESVTFPAVAEPRQVDVFEWICGRQLGSVEDGLDGSDADIAHRYFTLGRLSARLHGHATTWQPPKSFERHSWDVAGLMGEQPFWGRFWELEALSLAERALLLKTRAAVATDLAAYGTGRGDYSLIHADLVPENVLVDGERVRVIDFDDAGFGWHLFDMATSLYFIRAAAYFELAQEAFFKGYRSFLPLSDEQLSLMPLFTAARATTYLGWVHTRSESDTAAHLAPFLIEAACLAAERYLSGRRGG